MALSRTERFKLKSRLLDAIDIHDGAWSLESTNVLLHEFGFDTLDGRNWNDGGFTFADSIATIQDSDLVEMCSIVLDIPPKDVVEDIEPVNSGNWQSGYVRLFISQSAKHKSFVGQLAAELAVVGIHGFVAHDTMQYSKPWQAQIEQALESMQAFLAVVHPEFHDSAWCNQEVGWAYGRHVPKYFVRVGVDPTGFPGHDQWPSGEESSAKQLADKVTAWVQSIPELGESMVDGLLTALGSAGNYVDAGATASRIAVLNQLTGEQWDRLDKLIWANDQVGGGVLATRELKPFYRLHDRSWPPPRPDVLSHKSVVADIEEAPF